MTERKRVLIVSILGDPESLPPGIYDGAPEGSNDLAWIRRRLGNAGLEDAFDLTFVDISQGEPLPRVESFDAVVMGGSYHNANEGRDWQLRGLEWLREWRNTGRPLFGICGGHQLAAVALGGSVAVMEHGPNACTVSVELTEVGCRHFAFEGCAFEPRVHLGHFDHVDRAPPGSEVLAAHDDVVMALDMGGDWLTVQFHPEATADLMVRGWNGELGDLAGRYHCAHDGQRIVANFFTSERLVGATAEVEQ